MRPQHDVSRPPSLALVSLVENSAAPLQVFGLQRDSGEGDGRGARRDAPSSREEQQVMFSL